MWIEPRRVEDRRDWLQTREMAASADNSTYQTDAGAYDLENEGRARTMLRKAACVASCIGSERRTCLDILEVGCGTGLFTELLARYFPNGRITATDAFEPMIEIARARLCRVLNVVLAQYDAESSGCFAKVFDVVCGMDIIHHLNRPVQAMRYWRQIVKPGGRLVFFESNAWNPVLRLRLMNRPEEARFKYSTGANLIRWLREAGWTDATVEYIPLYLPNGPRRLWPVLDRIETVAHSLLVARHLSGGMILSAQAG